MLQTARYCIDCLMDLAPDNAATPEDEAILGVIISRKGDAPNYARHRRSVSGSCEKCGETSVLVYYEVP
jgi:hypothetical protein